MGGENPEQQDGKRPKDRKPGETVLYDANGNQIKLGKPSHEEQETIEITSQNGRVIVKGAKTVTVEATESLHLKGATGITIDGDIAHNGSLVSTGSHTASSHGTPV